MSSFISSLLNQLGTRTRRHRHPQPEGEAENSRSQQTKPSSTNDQQHSLIYDLGSKCGGLETTAGDAGTSHGPPFFSSLPKDMDGRSPEQESTRPVPHIGPETNQVVGTTENSSNPARIVDTTLPPGRIEDLRSQHGGSIGPRGSDSPLGHEGPGPPASHTFNLDELGQVSLPEDDGMGWLRNKIHAIRALNLCNNEKARMIHGLMTEKYNSSRIPSPSLAAAMHPTPVSATLEQNAGSPDAGIHRLSISNQLRPTLTAFTPSYENSFSLSPEDLRPTYAPKPEPESPVVEVEEEDTDTEDIEEAALGCQHYQRNVKLQCHTCKKWYTCRFCHDQIEDHHLIRRDTENMLCMLCGHAQPAAQACRQCGEQTAQYYCGICKLWDNDGKKSIYHCNDCGICRIGQGLGKDFFHCKTCCVCLPISIEDTHRCIERSTQCDCPICSDYMFTSPETVVVMRCGHSIHSKCLSEYSKSSFRCPICSKTITNMESTFRNLDRTIESQPMPAEFKDTKGLIYCNDCGAKSIVKYHWLGLRCDLCESYNTAQIRLLQGDVSAVLEEEGVSENPARPRSSSLAATEESTSSMAALRMNTDLASQSRLSVPVSAGPDRRFVSYNMTHGRAVSPVVSNYFGLPPERESEKPSSLPFFGGLSRADRGGDYGALNFLSKKLRDRYGFLAGETALTDEAPEAEEEEEEEEDEDDGMSSYASATDDDDGALDGEDDDDGGEYIDIFGHR